MQVPLAIIAIFAVSVSLKLPVTQISDIRAKLRRIDFIGASILIVAAFILLLGLDRGGNVAWDDPITGVLLATSLALFSVFAYVEIKPDEKTQTTLNNTRSVREPFAPRRILLCPSLLAAYISNFFALASVMCMLFHIALYFQAVAHQSASRAGLGLLPAVAGGVIGSLAVGVLMQKTGKYWWLTVGVLTADLVGKIGVLAVTSFLKSYGTWAAVGIGAGT